MALAFGSMPTEALSATEARSKVESLERRAKRDRQESQARADRTTTVIAFGATRVASNLLDQLLPSIGGLKPVIEIGGALYGINEGIKGESDSSAAMLGGGLALSTGIVDKVSAFMVDTVGKFTNKAK